MKEFTSSSRKGPSVRPVLAAVLASFLLGGAVAGYAVYKMQDREPEVVQLPPSDAGEPSANPSALPTPTPSATASQAAEQAVARVEEQQGGIDQRLAKVAHPDVIHCRNK